MDDDRHPALASMLCFDVYAASRALMAVYRSQLAAHGLTYPQYLVLVVLWHDEHCTVKGLAEALHLDYGTLTPLLRRMEVSDLVTRTRRADDERSVDVAPTARGRALRAHHHGIQEAVLRATGLEADQVAALQQSLRTLSASATAAPTG